MNAMAVSFWCSLAILLTGASIFTWLYLKKKANRAVLTMIAVVTIGLSLIALRMFHYSLGSISIVEQLAVSVMDSIRYFAMGKSFSEIDDLPPEQIFHAYYSMEIFLSLLAPLCTATVLASLLRTILSHVRLSTNPVCPVYYFSELNERSLTLAKTLGEPDATGKRTKKTKIVFCKTGDRSPIRAEAQALGAVTVSDPIHMLRLPDPTRRQVRVFLIDNEEENNIQTFLKMQDQLCIPQADQAAQRPESDFMVFSTQEAAEMVFDEVLERLDKNTLAYDLHLINETRYVTQQLLMDHPLYEAAEACGKNRISVLVVGCGYLGMQVVKHAMICGMMDSYDFSIQVIDDQADRLEQQFFHEHPFLKDPSDIFPAGRNQDPSKPPRPALAPRFHKANVCTTSFDTVLKEHCSQCNYIVVATGDDQLNITTAQYLRRWYTRQVLCENETNNMNPLVFAAVRSPERYTGMKALEQANHADSGFCGKLYLFANNMDIYSSRYILNRPLDAAAAILNSCYSQVKNAYDERKVLNWNEEIRRASKKQLLWLPIMTQRSNQMAALHSLYKLQDLLCWSKSESMEDPDTCYSLEKCSGENTIPSFFRLVQLMIRRKGVLLDLEHRRWTLFHALNGWTCYPKAQLLSQLESDDKLRNQDKPHKNTAARLHCCMIPTDQLDELEMDLLKHTGRKPDFSNNDKVMCLVSLFVWLELTAEPQITQQLLEALRNNLKPENASQEMLQQIRQVSKQTLPHR